MTMMNKITGSILQEVMRNGLDTSLHLKKFRKRTIAGQDGRIIINEDVGDLPAVSKVVAHLRADTKVEVAMIAGVAPGPKAPHSSTEVVPAVTPLILTGHGAPTALTTTLGTLMTMTVINHTRQIAEGAAPHLKRQMTISAPSRPLNTSPRSNWPN